FVSILSGAPTLEDLFQSSPVRLPWKICSILLRCASLGRFVSSFSGAPTLEDLFHPSPVYFCPGRMFMCEKRFPAKKIRQRRTDGGQTHPKNARQFFAETLIYIKVFFRLREI
ncbi:MAG: hypothetical protein PVH88_00005, partial [Ignavibacteria bacterium]